MRSRKAFFHSEKRLLIKFVVPQLRECNRKLKERERKKIELDQEFYFLKIPKTIIITTQQ